jgi:hypothetical protein
LLVRLYTNYIKNLFAHDTFPKKNSSFLSISKGRAFSTTGSLHHSCAVCPSDPGGCTAQRHSSRSANACVVREPPSGPAHRLRSNAGRVREHHQRSRSLCLTPARDREGIGISRESDLARLTAGRAFSFRPVAILPFLRAWRPVTATAH